jgi:hypothetical protein
VRTAYAAAASAADASASTAAALREPGAELLEAPDELQQVVVLGRLLNTWPSWRASWMAHIRCVCPPILKRTQSPSRAMLTAPSPHTRAANPSSTTSCVPSEPALLQIEASHRDRRRREGRADLVYDHRAVVVQHPELHRRGDRGRKPLVTRPTRCRRRR